MICLLCNKEAEIGYYCYFHWIKSQGINHRPDSDELDKDNTTGKLIKEREEYESKIHEKLNR